MIDKSFLPSPRPPQTQQTKTNLSSLFFPPKTLNTTHYYGNV